MIIMKDRIIIKNRIVINNRIILNIEIDRKFYKENLDKC